MNFSGWTGGIIVCAAVFLFNGMVWAGEGCEYNGVVYSGGSFTCQAGYGYICKDGSWDILKTACSAQPHAGSAGKSAEIGKGVCGCTMDEKNFCYASGRACVAEGDAGKCVKKCK